MTEQPGPPADPETVLKVVREVDAESVVLVLHGELDISTMSAAQREVEAAECDQPAVMIIDLSQLTFVDSSGVRLVLLADERARAAGRRLAVRLGTGPARRVFAVLGLVERLDIADDPPAAHR